MTYTIPHFINGKKQADSHDKYHKVYNPALGTVAGNVAFANEKEINQAIAAAKIAFPEWANTIPLRRARVIFKFKELLEKNIDELAELITREHGKVLADARGSILRGIELTEFACGIPNLLKGNFSENVGTNVDSYTMRQPLGVCVGVTPFNFPVMVPIWMFVPAIACGNTFILKPSEKDPSAPLRLAELMQEAGLPSGVLNVVHGAKEAVDRLITHADVVAVSCVGSTPVAEYIYKMAIAHGKRAHTFGGAKNHCLVMEDANVNEAAEAVANAAYGSAGERCMAVSVVVAVGDKVADTLVNRIQEKIKTLKIAPGTDPKAEMGPLITKAHLQRVKNYVDIGVKEGAKLVVDGRDFALADYEKGFFMGPCLFDQVKPDMRIYREEIFGPVLVIVRVPDFNSALELVNKHEYGNGTAIFTRNGSLARAFASRVQVGMVGINVPIPVPVAYHTFGGWKQSLFGDTYLHSDESVKFYTKSKTVTMRWPKEEKASYYMPHH